MTVRVKKIKHPKRKTFKQLSKRATLTLPFLVRVYNRWDMALAAKPVSSLAKSWRRRMRVLRFAFGKIKKQARGLALLVGLNLQHYVMRVRIKILQVVKSAKSFSCVRSVKAVAGFVIRATATALIPLLILAPAFSAFEAHIINVTAQPAQIDPPVLTPPGDIGWDNPDGGSGYTGTVMVVMSDADPDATHIYYTFGSGTDPGSIPDPVCGGPLGGPKEAPQQVSFTSDTVVKAIACDGNGSVLPVHKSVVNTKIYTFAIPCEDRLIPLDVMLVIDRSGSMARYKLQKAKEAAQSFMGNLDNSRDQVGLVSFSSTATLNEQLTNDFAGVSSTIASLTASGATNIADALDKANTELSSPRTQSSSTKVIILLTDGRANRPGLGEDNPTAIATAQAEADEAAQKGFLLYTIGLGADVNEAFLVDLAHRTGGEYFASPTAEQLAGIYNEIAKLLCGYGTISGYKFHDLNQDGEWATSTEPAIPGWKITLKRGAGSFGTVLTNQDGYYEFTDLPANVAFTVIEEARAGWAQTLPPGGQFTITLTSEGEHSANNNFGNFDTGQQCVPVPVTFPANLAVLAAGNTSGNDDVIISSQTVINGNVRSNDDINADGSGTNRTINGNAYAGDNVEQVNFTFIGGTYYEGYATTSLPLSATTIQAFKDHAKAGGTVNGSLEFPNNTIGLELGPSEILGNLEFGHSNAATIKGPLYVHGNLVIGQHTTITEYSSFGDLLAPIIVDGTIDVGDNVTFNGSGALGGFLLISTHTAVTGGDAAIETSSNNSDLGDVVLYAAAGDVHIRSNRTLLAIYAKHGTGSENPAIRLDSNVTVNWRAFGTELGCGPRLTPLNQILINEFMVNPDGLDNAVMPNGEWVELYNGSTTTPTDVNHWFLYDNNNAHELEIISANVAGGNTVIPPGGHLVVYRDGDSNFNLNNSSADMVRLYNGAIGSGATLMDSHTYNPPGGGMPGNKSITRTPDGTANWVDPEPTPGESSTEFINPDTTPSEPIVYENQPAADKQTEEILPPQPGESDYVEPEGGQTRVMQEPEGEQQELTQDPSVTEDVAEDVTKDAEAVDIPQEEFVTEEAGAATEESGQTELTEVTQEEQTEQEALARDAQVTEEATEQPAEDPSQTNTETVEGTEPKEEDLPPQDETAPEVAGAPPASDNPPVPDEPDAAETVQQPEDTPLI